MDEARVPNSWKAANQDAVEGSPPGVVLMAADQSENVFSLVTQGNLTVLTCYWSVMTVGCSLDTVVEQDALDVVAWEEG